LLKVILQLTLESIFFGTAEDKGPLLLMVAN
jgi:hypothetical protein